MITDYLFLEGLGLKFFFVVFLLPFVVLICGVAKPGLQSDLHLDVKLPFQPISFFLCGTSYYLYNLLGSHYLLGREQDSLPRVL